MKGRRLTLTGTLTALVAAMVISSAPWPAFSVESDQPPPPPAKPGDLGFTDTPRYPDLPWHVHDPARPHPPVVAPPATAGAPPADAEVLFDGRDLSKWVHRGPGGELRDATWVVRDGYFEVAPKTGTLSTRRSYGDVQLHVEWAAPTPATGQSQGRGNSGVFLMGLYEIQVLDSHGNPTYADGMAGAIYGQWPPRVNAARPPGEWQTYDIVFEAPRFENGAVTQPARFTVFWNGIVVHNRQPAMGRTVYRQVAKYEPHPAELPLTLQDHGNPVRYRNIWIRRLGADGSPRPR